MWAFRRAAWAAIAAIMVSAPAVAQTAPEGNEWSHGTSLNVFGGAAADSSKTGPLAGAAIGWEITPAFAIEGSGYWLDRGSGADAFAAALKVQVGLMVPHRAVPFLAAGVGLYHASFGPTADPVPDFYRQRMPAATSPGVTSTFTDPSFVVGGGVNIFVTPQIAIRPDVESMIVRRDSQNYVVTAVAVHFTYHFEGHPVTRAR